MHTVGLHSALAIKRQRKRREELKKSRERRFSSQSTESGIGASSDSPGSLGGSMDRLREARRKHKSNTSSLIDSKVVPPIGMLHIGIVFLVLGLFLIGSGLIPDEYTSWDQSINWWNELVCTGLFALGIGVFLIGLNHYLSQQEENELSAYVERQLTRSRSGKRLIKDEETGGLRTKHEHRANQAARTLTLDVDTDLDIPTFSSPTFSPTFKCAPSTVLAGPGPVGKTDLEKILEEESERGDDDYVMNMENFNKYTMGNGDVSPQIGSYRGHGPEARELVVTRFLHTNY